MCYKHLVTVTDRGKPHSKNKWYALERVTNICVYVTTRSERGDDGVTENANTNLEVLKRMLHESWDLTENVT